jgi:hypothetical protein
LIQGIKPLSDYVGGYNFTAVLMKYFEGVENNNIELRQNAIRWFRAEYSTKTEARKDLGVREIIDDDNIYTHLKLFAEFVRYIGYSGLLVGFDEMGVLSHRLANSRVRERNYELILEMTNDCLQGAISGLGVLMGGIPEFVEDPNKGLYSYGALQQRLAEDRFTNKDNSPFSGPIIRLQNLSRHELYELFLNIRDLFAGQNSGKTLLPDKGVEAFISNNATQLGDEYFRTPRDRTKEFVGFVSSLKQNPNKDWRDILSNKTDSSGRQSTQEDADLVHFEL